MTTAAPSTALAAIQPAFTDAERLALAGYRSLTREAYALGLRQFTTWCRARSVALFAVWRAGIESFARELEARGRARATVTRRLCTIAGFCKYAVEEELIDHSPAAHIRRPRVDCESRAVALDRNELGALLVAAGLGPPGEHALISLLALNGLRVSEATGADIEDLGLERGHRTLTITRKGGKVVTIPLAPRTARAIDLAIGERTGGPVFLAADGRRLDRHGAGRIVRKTARRSGIGKAVTPHTLRHAFITAALDAGVPLRDVQEAASHADPRTTMRYQSGPAAAWTGTPPTSSPPTLPEPPGSSLCRRYQAPAALLRAAGQHQAVRSEVAEVGRVERHQRYLVAQAARRDPGVMLRPGPSTQLGGPGQRTPHPGRSACRTE
jgi:integrase/recombinase XerD